MKNWFEETVVIKYDHSFIYGLEIKVSLVKFLQLKTKPFN